MKKPNYAEHYAELTTLRNQIEDKMKAVKEQAIHQVQTLGVREEGNPFITTSYGNLILASRTKYSFDPETEAKVEKLKARIKDLEEQAIEAGTAKSEDVPYLQLRALQTAPVASEKAKRYQKTI